MAEHTAWKARIASVIAATGVSLACGTNYAYSAWAPEFAKHMHLSATQSNIIGVAGNLGMYASGVPVGILIDSRSPRWGVFLGAIMLFGGYFPLHRAYDDGPGSMSVGLLSFFSFLTGVGSCTCFTAAIKTATFNWPDHRGTATALPLSGFGLSAFFFATIASLAFGDDISSFLLMLAVGTICLNVASFIFMRLIPTPHSYSALPSVEETRPGVKRVDSNPMRPTKSSTTENCPPTETGKSPQFHPMPHSLRDSTAHTPTTAKSGQNDDETSSLMLPSSISSDDFADHELSKHAHGGSSNVEITGLKLLPTAEFWQLFSMLGLLSGVGLMTINNIGNDARALWTAYNPNASSNFIQGREQFHVSILSLCSFLGRFLSGIGSDLLIKRFHASRLWCLFTSALVFTLAQFAALLISHPSHLILVSSLTGLGYGALFGVFPALVADAFGVHGLSLNWGFMIFAPVVTGNIYNLCYGKIFDGHSSVEGECSEGLGCYRDAYWITLASSGVGVLLSLWCIRYELLKKRKAASIGRERVA